MSESESRTNEGQLDNDEAFVAAVAEIPKREEIRIRKNSRDLQAWEEQELEKEANELSDQVVEEYRHVRKPKEAALAKRDETTIVSVRKEIERMQHLETLSHNLVLQPETRELLQKFSDEYDTRWLKKWRKPQDFYDIDLMAHLVEVVGQRYTEKIYDLVMKGELFSSEEGETRANFIKLGSLINEGIRNNAKSYNLWGEERYGENKKFSANDLEESAFKFVEYNGKQIGKAIEQIGRGYLQATISLLDALHHPYFSNKKGKHALPIKMDKKELQLLNDIILPARTNPLFAEEIGELDALLAIRSVHYIGEKEGYKQSDEVKGFLLWDEESRQYKLVNDED